MIDEHDVKEHATRIGSNIAEEGPEALFRELDDMLPEYWRDQINNFPITAVVLGVGLGIYLGMTRSDELIEAGASFVSAAATANIAKILGQHGT